MARTVSTWTSERRARQSRHMRRHWKNPAYRARLREANRNAYVPQRRCERCKKWYQPTSKCQRFCGKQKVKGTCSWHRGRELTKKFIQDNPERVAKYRRQYAERLRKSPALRFRARLTALKKHLRRFGLSYENYLELCAKQKNLCAICERPNTQRLNAKDQRLAVDHDHATGLFRGLLCDFCNTGLGLFLDNPRALRQAARYIERHLRKAFRRATKTKARRKLAHGV